MKLWTYGEASAKLLQDLDLQDESFVSADELAGYFNEGLEEAGSEIDTLDADYFLTKYFVPVLQGVGRYPLPPNIYANKIRGIMYQNGSVIYPVVQYRRRYKFQNIAFTDQYGQMDDYRHLLTNDMPGQSVLEIHPLSRETAILPPSPSAFTPLVLWYYRNCSRVPLTNIGLQNTLGEWCNPELLAPAQVDPIADTLQTFSGTLTQGIPTQGVPGSFPGSIPYVTGDAVMLVPGPNGALPAPLVQGVTYYAIALGAGLIQLATSKANALAGTAINLTTQGTVYSLLQVAATPRIQAATILDIPEFTKFIIQWAKCRCFEKEGDPRIEGAAATLVQQKKQMVDTLTHSIPDDNDEIEPDYSHYQEMT